MELGGLEPPTPCLQSRCSSQLSYSPLSPARLWAWQELNRAGTARALAARLIAAELPGSRTHLRIHLHREQHAGPAVGLAGVEPATSRLSGVRSNHLSYKPIFTDPPRGKNTRPTGQKL